MPRHTAPDDMPNPAKAKLGTVLQTGMGAKQAAQARMLDRRNKVAALLLRDFTPAQIGRELGVSRQLARKDVQAILKSWDTELKTRAGLVRTHEIMRLRDYEHAMREDFDRLRTEGKAEMAARVFDRINKVLILRTELEGLRMPATQPHASQAMQVVIQGFEYEGPQSGGSKALGKVTIEGRKPATQAD